MNLKNYVLTLFENAKGINVFLKGRSGMVLQVISLHLKRR